MQITINPYWAIGSLATCFVVLCSFLYWAGTQLIRATNAWAGVNTSIDSLRRKVDEMVVNLKEHGEDINNLDSRLSAKFDILEKRVHEFEDSVNKQIVSLSSRITNIEFNFLSRMELWDLLKRIEQELNLLLMKLNLQIPSFDIASDIIKNQQAMEAKRREGKQ